MFVIATEKGYFKDIWPARAEVPLKKEEYTEKVYSEKQLFTRNKEDAKTYEHDFWAEEVIKCCLIRNAKVVEVDAG